MSTPVADVHTTTPGRGVRVRVFDDGDRVSVVHERQVRFSPNARPDEVWSRYRRATKQVFSMRRGVLDVYGVGPSGTRTITPRIRDCIGDIAFAASLISDEAHNVALTALGDTVLDVAARHGLALLPEARRRGLHPMLVALAYPLLGRALHDGGLPPLSLPLGVTRTLRAPSARAGAVAAFGKTNAPRSVVRAFATNLRCGPSTWADTEQRLSLQTVLVASVASRALDTPRLCALLAVPTRGDHPAVWDRPAVRRSVRDLLRQWTPRGAYAVAEAALLNPRGLLLLADAALAWEHLRRPPMGRVPRSLDALHSGLVDAASGKDASGTDVLLTDFVPAAILALEGLETTNFSFDLPKTAAQLSSWGRELENCLAGYASGIAQGTSWIVGVRKGGRLTYAVELHHARGIRQFAGIQNSTPDPADAAEVAAALNAHGVTGGQLRAARNQPPRELGYHSLLQEVAVPF